MNGTQLAILALSRTFNCYEKPNTPGQSAETHVLQSSHKESTTKFRICRKISHFMKIQSEDFKRKKDRSPPSRRRVGEGQNGFMNRIYFRCHAVTLRLLVFLSLERHKWQIYDLIFYHCPAISFSVCSRT